MSRLEVCPFKKVITTKTWDDEKEVSIDFGECNGNNCPYFYEDPTWNQHCRKVEEGRR